MQHSFTLQSFIAADLNRKDKAAFHNVRMGIVTKAIVSALTGNATEWRNAKTAATGKGKLAKAYATAFEAFPEPERFPYKGKLSEAVRAQIEAEADRLADLWSAAFIGVFPVEPAPELTDEEKAAKKAEREAKAKAEAIKIAEAEGYVKPMELSPAAMADQIVALVQSGQISGENLAHVAAAVNAAVAADAEASRIIRAARKVQREPAAA